MSSLSWNLPRSTPQIYYLDPKFTSLCCRKLQFEPATVKYRMTFYEYIELVQDLRARGSPNLSYVKLAKIMQWLFTVFFVAVIIVLIVNEIDLTLKSSSYFFQALVGYAISFAIFFWIQTWQERLAVRKMRIYLDTINAISYNAKQLHWEIHEYARYLLVYLDYSLIDIPKDDKPVAFQSSTIELFFNKKRDSLTTAINVDYSTPPSKSPSKSQ